MIILKKLSRSDTYRKNLIRNLHIWPVLGNRVPLMSFSEDKCMDCQNWSALQMQMRTIVVST